MTPLLYTCKKRPSFLVIQQLIELGADLSARDKVSQNSHFSLALYSILCRMNKMHCIWLHRAIQAYTGQLLIY